MLDVSAIGAALSASGSRRTAPAERVDFRGTAFTAPAGACERRSFFDARC
ncbi:MAG TPA: hypothetical protein VGU26_08835 [Gaiellaceae bacterium]|nr:hypothetical protein [Gaiellaceae bacterium]